MRREKQPLAETKRLVRLINQLAPRGIFATGIENSDPWVDGMRRDELAEAFDFSQNYRSRLDNIANLGLKWLRFGVGYSQTHPEKDRFDFELTDQVLDYCDHLGLNVIADLLHFGLPEWQHGDNPDRLFFQNPEFPFYFAEYARTFAKRYPKIRYFTPINEPFVTARLSAKDGYWNEKIVTDWSDCRPLVRAISNLARAQILSKRAIEQVWREEKRGGEPLFFQNESFEIAIATPNSKRELEAENFNLSRFAALDLMFAHADPAIKRFLHEHGLSPADFDWFMKMGSKKRTILGIDYYPWSVNQLEKDSTRAADPKLAEALFVLVLEYYKRYRMPLLHTEVNAENGLAAEICQRTFDCLKGLRQAGVPILGMSWFGDDLQVGWQSALIGDRGKDEFRVGLFYKGEAEPVAKLFAKLARQGLPIIEKNSATDMALKAPQKDT